MLLPSIINKSQYNNPKFKSNITFDIGGSQREGSCKIYYATSETDEKIHSGKTTVNTLGKKKFENNDDFINHIVQKVKIVQEGNEDKVKEMGYPKSENTLKSITLFLPSYTSGTYAYYLPNHKNSDDRPLKDLDFSDMKTRLENNGVKVSKNLQFRLLQDAMGTGLATAKNLYDNSMLQKGKYYTACITGGGCGIANIEMQDDENVIIKSSGSGYLSGGNALEKVSRAGASAPALIQNFCKAFGLNDEITDDIKSCHKAEFVLQDPITYQKDVKTKALKHLLLETNRFNLVNDNEKEYTLEVKDEYKDLYDRSRRSAIDKYCSAFAKLAIIKKNEGSNGLIITGPVARAVDKTAKEKYHTNVSNWVTDHLFSSYNTYELEKMQKTYQFKVYCDDRFFLEDNTAAKKLAHKTEFVSPERGNWIKLRIKDLKDNN